MANIQKMAIMGVMGRLKFAKNRVERCLLSMGENSSESEIEKVYQFKSYVMTKTKSNLKVWQHPLYFSLILTQKKKQLLQAAIPMGAQSSSLSFWNQGNMCRIATVLIHDKTF